MDDGEGVVICEDKHWVHGGIQIYIEMLKCQNESKALLFNSRVIIWGWPNFLEKYEIG